MDNSDSDNDGLEVVLNSPPPKDWENVEDEFVDFDSEALNLGTSEVNDNEHLPSVSAYGELPSDGMRDLEREIDTNSQDVTEAEEIDDEQSLVMPKRKKEGTCACVEMCH